MLAVINIWLDVIGFAIAFFLVFGFVIPHIIGNYLTGRLKQRFVDDYWLGLAHRWRPGPVSQDYPPITRIWHWVNITSFITLLVSGLYIRYPFFAGGREWMRLLHYIFMYIITANLIWRIAYFFLVDRKLYFTFSKEDIPVAIQVAKYYAFLVPEYPHKQKYHPIQRANYPVIWLLLLVQAITGFSIVWPNLYPAFVSNLFGGPAALAAWMRLFHSINMRLLVYIAMFHAYLGIMEDFPTLKLFWFWKEPDLSKYKHEHEHGHEEEELPSEEEEPGSEETQPAPAH